MNAAGDSDCVTGASGDSRVSGEDEEGLSEVLEMLPEAPSADLLGPGLLAGGS